MTIHDRGSAPLPSLTRRELLGASGLGFGTLALSYLLHAERSSASEARLGRGLDLASRAPHFAPRARAVIMLMQNGGPSQMDLFDPKPELARQAGKTMTVETFQKGNSDKLMASPLAFQRYGQCGMDMAAILPHLGSTADDICLVRSMFSEHNNHTEGLVLLNTGKIFPGRPALGSWISYGLGTENQNLPAYIVLRDPEGYNTSGTLLWQNGWLPSLYRGTEVATQGVPVRNLQPPAPVAPAVRRDNLDLLAKLNEEHRRGYPHESELETRIRNYELAARMQLAAGEVLDLSRESEPTKAMYGLGDPVTAGYGLRCLMARRLVESGVRFVQVCPPVKPQSQPWDAHTNVKTENEAICARTDLPSAALIKDLKARGLLEDTIVLWSGEFGRLPVSQNGAGRDHNRNAFSLIVAGGGFRAGQIHGATDEVGYKAADQRVSVPDLHATILHQLGLDHTRLTYHHHGSDESLTDARVTKARVVTELLDNPART
ncbi:MAG: DUF1501 domain-containing protein [Isosphaeraceae bacterium]|nr:DUF1501 domain-containing protein [Isosphaeraceae bacterium]